jgi:hypothetical protein
MAPLPATASGLGDSLIDGRRYRGHPLFAAGQAEPEIQRADSD